MIQRLGISFTHRTEKIPPNQQSYINDKRIYLSFANIETNFIKPAKIKETGMKVGDTVGFGAQVWNSDVGLSSLTVGQFMIRLACENGMISRETLNVERLIHTTQNLFQSFTYALKTIS